MAAVWHPLSMPSAAVGGGPRPALIGDATRLHSATKGDGPPQRSRSFSAEYARVLTAGNNRERHAHDGVDLKAAQRFLDLLGAKRCTLQTFDDNAARKDPKLARILHGSLDDHADALEHLNRQGAGVFVTVNRTDLKGRKRENIKRVRAVSLDLDAAPLDPVLQCKLKPHLVVETSPGRYQCFWRVTKLPHDKFKGVQRSIAKRFNGDPAIALLTQCTRLPGFYHQKSKPFQTHIISAHDAEPYTAREILDEFPPIAKPHKPSGSLAGRLVLPIDDPLPCAKEFVAGQFTTPEGVTCLHYYRGSFYQWTGTHYAEIELKELRSKLYEFLGTAVTKRGKVVEPFKPTPTKVNSIVDALEALVLQSREKEAPFWVGPKKDELGDGLIACRNGVLNLLTRELLPHNPRLFIINCLPYKYDPAAPTYPRQWMKFLRQLWPGKAGKRARRALQEMFGLLLTSDTRHQKIFLIVGPKRSGKGTIARVLTALLGKDNVTAPTLAGLSSHFGLSALINKRAAIIPDARLGPRADVYTVAERLLSISGEDALTIDRKYREPWTGRLNVRFLILTNELPRIADASGALASRFVLLTLTESFYGKEDHDLTQKLLTELPGILNWALRGLDRLRERGHFQIPRSSREAAQSLRIWRARLRRSYAIGAT